VNADTVLREGELLGRLLDTFVAAQLRAELDSNPARRIKRTQSLCAVLSGVVAGRRRAKTAKFWAQLIGTDRRLTPFLS
jgi:hypothetical protein